MSGPRVLEACQDDHASRALWLEAELLGTSLATVVDELSVIHETDRGEGPSVEEARYWLGEDADPVLRDGLMSLSKAKLDELFRRPSLLPALQELVLVDGGEYWNDAVARSEVLAATSKYHRRQLARRLGLREPTPSPESRPAAADAPGRNSAGMRRWLIIAVPVAMAASLIVALTLPSFIPPETPGDPSPPVTAVATPDVAEPRETTRIVKVIVPESGPVDSPDPLASLAVAARGWSHSLAADGPVSVEQVAAIAVESRRSLATAIDALERRGMARDESRSSDVLKRFVTAAATLDAIENVLSTSEGDRQVVARERQRLLMVLGGLIDIPESSGILDPDGRSQGN